MTSADSTLMRWMIQSVKWNFKLRVATFLLLMLPYSYQMSLFAHSIQLLMANKGIAGYFNSWQLCVGTLI